jgi:ABC-type bacteriocin/lantibiotic exporter with double-glycine peptidase domain
LLLLLPAGIAAPKSIWIDVPFIAQPRDGCGAASIAMIMQYWATQQHRPITAVDRVDTVQKQVYSPHLHGATPTALEAYLQNHGYLTFAVKGSWEQLGKELKKGRPLVVALRPSGQRALHYVVIDGIDNEHELVMMNDPEVRKLLPEGKKQFEKEWSATHNWMLLALPRQPNS